MLSAPCTAAAAAAASALDSGVRAALAAYGVDVDTAAVPVGERMRVELVLRDAPGAEATACSDVAEVIWRDIVEIDGGGGGGDGGAGQSDSSQQRWRAARLCECSVGVVVGARHAAPALAVCWRRARSDGDDGAAYAALPPAWRQQVDDAVATAELSL